MMQAERRSGSHVAYWQILLQKDFQVRFEEKFSPIETHLRKLIHRTGCSDSIIAQFRWPGCFKETFAKYRHRTDVA